MTTRYLCALLLAASPAAAHAQADPLRDEGVALRSQGRDAEALAVFERAHAQSGSARTLAQVALAEQALGRWGAAGTHLEAALARPDAWVQQNQPALAAARAEIARHTGSLVVAVDQPGARVTVAGRDVGRTPLAAPVVVTAGTVHLRVDKNGVVIERTIEVAVGASAQESVTLGAAAAGGGDGGALPIVGGILLAAGVGAAAGMGIAWGLREADAATYNGPGCWPAGSTRDEACGDLRASVDASGAAAIGLGIGAIVLVGTGVALLAVGGGGSGERASIGCAPLPGGLTCGGSF